MSGNEKDGTAARSGESSRAEIRMSTRVAGMLTLLFVVPLAVVIVYHFVSSNHQLPAGSVRVQITANAPNPIAGGKCSINESWPHDGHSYVELVHLSGACPAANSVTTAYATPGGSRLVLSGGDTLAQRLDDYRLAGTIYAVLACLCLGGTVVLRRGDRKAARLARSAESASGVGSPSLQGAH